MDNETKQEFGEIAQNIAPYGIIMAVFTLCYSIWFCFAWDTLGIVLFALTVIYGACIAFASIKNIKHAKRFKAVPSEAGKKIVKKNEYRKRDYLFGGYGFCRDTFGRSSCKIDFPCRNPYYRLALYSARKNHEQKNRLFYRACSDCLFAGSLVFSIYDNNDMA